jgi:hypothetical protein
VGNGRGRPGWRPGQMPGQSTGTTPGPGQMWWRACQAAAACGVETKFLDLAESIEHERG